MRVTFKTARRDLRSTKAFTLAEFLITSVMMVVVIGAAMAAYIYGLRMLQFTNRNSAPVTKHARRWAFDGRCAFGVDISWAPGQ